MTKHIAHPGKLPGRFNALVALFPPHAIRDEIDYDNTVEIIEMLLRIGETKMTKGQTEYLETLSQLISVYDQEHYAAALADISAIDVLKELMRSRGMNASDLGEVLGNRSLGSKILRGERELSKAHIKKLAEHFHVRPGLFL